MDIKIRRLKAGDNLSAAGMIRKVFVEHNAPQDGTVYSDPTTDDLYGLFRAPGSILWVAELGGEIIGCCGVFPTPGLPEKCAELVKYYLARDFRGRGIGKELMLRSIQSAKKFGYKQLYLESLPHFSKALGIYEKQGFVRLMKPMGKSQHPTCNIWMLLEI